MKFNTHLTNEIRDSFIYGAIASFIILFISFTFFDVSNEIAFLLQGITWMFYFNVSYFFMNKSKKNEYPKLIFINLTLITFTFFMIFG